MAILILYVIVKLAGLGDPMEIGLVNSDLQFQYFMEALQAIGSMPSGHCLGALKIY